MAANEDDLTDLNELGISDDVDESPDFQAASQHIQRSDLKLDNATLLQLYRYYKQSTQGDCNIEKPKWYQYREKAKWDAWNEVKGTSKAEAQKQYVQLVMALDPTFQQATVKSEGWVTVSTLQQPLRDTEEDEDSEIFQLVKSGNCLAVGTYFADKSDASEINALSVGGMGLIHWAADRNDLEMLAVLLDLGCDVNLKDSDGQSALHYASSCGHLQALNLLLKRGSDLTIANADGLDALAVAYDDSIKEVIQKFVV